MAMLGAACSPCCSRQSCGRPHLSPYSVEAGGFSSWDFRCGRPASIPQFSVNGPCAPSNSEIRTASQALCGAVGCLGQYRTNGEVTSVYNLGGNKEMTNLFFYSSNPPNDSRTELGAVIFFPPMFYQLDIGFLYNSFSGLWSWTFRASARINVPPLPAWWFTSVEPFYSQTVTDKKCVYMLESFDDPYFHLPSPTLFVFSSVGITVDLGTSSQVFPWTGRSTGSFGYNLSDFITSDFVITVRRYFSCFKNCVYTTNLCCNPLP